MIFLGKDCIEIFSKLWNLSEVDPEDSWSAEEQLCASEGPPSLLQMAWQKRVANHPSVLFPVKAIVPFVREESSRLNPFFIDPTY